MTHCFVYFVFLFLISSISYILAINREDLINIASNIKAKTDEFRGNKVEIWNLSTNLQYFYTKYRNNEYKSYILSHEPVLVVAIDINEDNFGESFGNYYEALSISRLIGTHFIGIWMKNPSGFLQYLPCAVPNRDVGTREHSLEKLTTIETSPWQQYLPLAIWPSNIGALYPIFKIMLKPYIAHRFNITTDNWNDDIKRIGIPISFFDLSNIEIRNQNITLTKNKHEIIPFLRDSERRQKYFNDNHKLSGNYELYSYIPDVAIYVSCLDILRQSNSIDGFINFHVYVMIIPIKVKTIYIFTESSKRRRRGDSNNDNYQYDDRCDDIMTALLLFLNYYYPNTIITLRKGSFFDALITIMEAKLVICSASLFCFWPSLSTNHVVHFPLTSLVVEGKPRLLTDHWNWMSVPKLHRFPYFIDQENTLFYKNLHSLMHFQDSPK